MNDDERALAARLLLRAALKQFGGPLSQGQLAGELGISQGMISKMVGHDAGISDDTMNELAAFYGLGEEEMDDVLARISSQDEDAALAEMGAVAMRRAQDRGLINGPRHGESRSLGPSTRRPRGRTGPSVLSVPAFTVRTLSIVDVARDALGQLWVDPKAGSGPAEAATDGDGSPRLRFERFSDGTVRLDEEEVKDPGRLERMGLPDERHSLLVTDETDIPRTALRRVYLGTVLELVRDGRPIRRYTARPARSVKDERRDDRSLAKNFISDLPSGTSSLVVLTAANPRGRRLRDDEVEMRMKELEARLKGYLDLDTDGPSGEPRVWDVIAKSPEGVSEWTEPSFGACDLPLEAAHSLARDYRQMGFFVVTEDEFQLHWTEPAPTRPAADDGQPPSGASRSATR